MLVFRNNCADMYSTDILIEDAKNHLKTWGSQPPTFLLCNGALTAQLTMIPEKTNYLTNGPDGLKRLADGPELSSYRGLSIIPTRKFSMDAGTAPRDLLRRRVRVAEYYRIPWSEDNPRRTFEFYDQSRDTMFRLSWDQLCAMADLGGGDDADDDDSMGGQHHQWAFSKVGRNIVYRGSHLSESVTDAVIITGDNAGDSLTLPAVHCVNGRRERKKRKRADVQGRQLTSIRNPGALQKSNMSVADAMNSISNPTYHESSETFGGGIFNDPLTVDAAFNDNFKGIADADLNIGQNFIYWCAVRSFQWACESADFRIADLEQSVASGMGDFVCGPNWMFDNKVPARVEMIFRILFYRFSRTAAEAVKFQRGVERLNHETAMTLTSQELFEVWNTAGNAGARAAFQNFAGQPATKVALNTYLGTNTDQELEALLGDINIANIGDSFADRHNPANANYYQNWRNTKFTDTNARMSTYWTGWGTGYANFTGLVKQPAIKALFDYGDLLTQWAGDIWMEKAYDGFVMPNEVTRFMNDVQGKQAHHCFPELRRSIIQDILHKYVNFYYQSAFDDADVDKRETLIYERQDFVREFAERNAIMNTVWNASNMTVYNTFLHDFKYHNEAGVIASNMANSDKFQGVFRPNLHITRCDPLTAADMEKSASSMNESTWLIQQLAGTMPLSTEMCDVLMSQAIHLGTDHEETELRREYARFLTGHNNAHHPQSAYNTLLMHWFMSRFHPIKQTREHAKARCILEDACKNYLVQAMGNLLRNNQTFSVELESAFKELKPEGYSEKTGFYCPGVAATEYCNLPSYVSEMDQDCAAVGTKIPWQNVPVFDKEAIRPTKYTPNLRYNTVSQCENFLKQNLKTFQPNALRSHENGAGQDVSYNFRFGNMAVETDANKEIYNPLTGTYEPAANSRPLHVRLPWTYYLTSVMDQRDRYTQAGSAHRQPAFSGLTFNMFMMDANSGMIDADALKQPICSNEIAYMRNDAAALCSDFNATDMVLDHVLLVLANRFWKPTSRFMHNGAGVPLVNAIPEVLVSNPVQSMALNIPAAAPAAGGDRAYVVQGNGCHFSHGPRLPTVGGGGGGGGMNATDIVILRPNIEHEMLGVIMGRGGTQELGATFWGQV